MFKQVTRFSIMTLLVAGMAFSLASCGRNLDSNQYVDSSTTGLVLEGTILNVRPVKIKPNDKFGDNKAGALVGAGAGGLAGSRFGQGGGKAAAVVGGAVVGGLLGALAEDQLSETDGLEYIVKLSPDSEDVSQSTATFNSSSNATIADKIKNNTSFKAKTKIISVVQGKDVILQPGQPVYVIYSDDRPRLVPAQ